jgi:hypothetical protein
MDRHGRKVWMLAALYERFPHEMDIQCGIPDRITHEMAETCGNSLG